MGDEARRDAGPEARVGSRGAAAGDAPPDLVRRWQVRGLGLLPRHLP